MKFLATNIREFLNEYNTTNGKQMTKIIENNDASLNKSELFKRELKLLLAKYNADIYADMVGDTHGVSVEIVIDIDNKEVIRQNDSLSQYDI